MPILEGSTRRFSREKKRKSINFITVKVMIMSRYRPVTSPLPFWALRYRPLQTVTDRYRILPLLALQALQTHVYKRYRS